MNSKSETVADILVEMRNIADNSALYPFCLHITGRNVKKWADRIEAAAKRDASEAELKWSRIGYEERMAEEKKRKSGDTAAMREVLEEMANMPQCEDCAGKEAPNCDSCCKETIFSPYVKSARAALAAPPEPVGNAAAMRETLVKLREDLWEMMGATSESFQERKACDMAQRIRAALSAPARNCDVGTAEEQEERFDAFCARHYGTNDMSGDNCRICPLSPMGCKLAWAQMPYEKEGGRGVK